MLKFNLFSIYLTAFVTAKTFNVTVGQNGLVFNPNSIQAKLNDQINFIFYPKNHSILQSTFIAPCSPLAGGFDSGFMPVASNEQSPQITLKVTQVSTPIWLHCSQTPHCSMGMVFSINPTANKTFAAFLANAKGGNSTTSSITASPSLVGGGGGGSLGNGGSVSLNTPSAAITPTGTILSVPATTVSTTSKTSSASSIWLSWSLTVCSTALICLM